MSKIDWGKLRTAGAIAAEQAKAEAITTERAALSDQIRAGLPANNIQSVVARIDAIEKLLGLKPLDAEG